MNRQPPLADSPAAACRRLIRTARSAALATAMPGRRGAAKGWPYGSLVTVACDTDASPILLLSQLSDHTRNLGADGRASLLFEATSRRSNPQTGPRVTVMGRVEKTTDQRLARRFLARHPDAALYSGFADFGFYRMAVERAHYVGGFAKAVWIKGQDLLSEAKAAAALAALEQGVLEHMNSDHAEAIELYAGVLLSRRGKGWKMVGIDAEGADLRRGALFARLDFEPAVSDSGSCRRALSDLAKRARAAS
jgi:putative heme iron utilization protein